MTSFMVEAERCQANRPLTYNYKSFLKYPHSPIYGMALFQTQVNIHKQKEHVKINNIITEILNEIIEIVKLDDIWP